MAVTKIIFIRALYQQILAIPLFIIAFFGPAQTIAESGLFIEPQSLRNLAQLFLAAKTTGPAIIPAILVIMLAGIIIDQWITGGTLRWLHLRNIPGETIAFPLKTIWREGKSFFWRTSKALFISVPLIPIGIVLINLIFRWIENHCETAQSSALNLLTLAISIKAMLIVFWLAFVGAITLSFRTLLATRINLHFFRALLTTLRFTVSHPLSLTLTYVLGSTVAVFLPFPLLHYWRLHPPESVAGGLALYAFWSIVTLFQAAIWYKLLSHAKQLTTPRS